IDRLWRAWSPSFTLDSARRDELHALSQAQPARTARVLPRDRAPAHDVLRSHAQGRDAHCNTPVAAPWQRGRLHRAADRRGPSVVRRACPRDHAEPRPLPARGGSRHDRRARRPLVGVALRCVGCAARREPAADRDLLGSARVAGDRPTASCRPALYANRSSHYRFKPGDAATTSWPRWRRLFTSFVPMSPVPPITTIFILLF